MLTNEELNGRTVRDLMVDLAREVHPEKSLPDLVKAVAVPKYDRRLSDLKALYRIMNSGRIHLAPDFIAYYYPVSEYFLRDLKNNHAFGQE